MIGRPVTQPSPRAVTQPTRFPSRPEGPPPMVRTQDVVLLVAQSRDLLPFDLLPAGVVAVVLVAFAVALIAVSVRRRDAD